MTHRWGWLPLAACVLALWTAPAGAQSAVKDGQSDYMTGKSTYTGADTTFSRNVLGVPIVVHDNGNEVWRWMRGDASGYGYVREAYPDREYLFAPAPVSTDSLGNSKYGGDSTGVFDARFVKDPVLLIRMSHLYLDATAVVRVAVQVRILTAAAQDTTNLYPWRCPRTGSIAASGDTLGTALIGTLMTQDANKAPIAGTASLSEFILTFQAGAPARSIVLTGLKGARIAVKARPLSLSTGQGAPKLWFSMVANGL